MVLILGNCYRQMLLEYYNERRIDTWNIALILKSFTFNQNTFSVESVPVFNILRVLKPQGF